MAIPVKDAAASAAKFVANAQVAGPAYSAGVANAAPAWAANTKAAADTWAQGVTQAAANGRFSAGVNSNSQNKYQTRASGVGVQRYPQGVAQAGPSWQAATQPYLQTIAGLNLPPRQPKGSPANIQRVAAIATALNAKKLQQG
jgi:hypothetical protein